MDNGIKVSIITATFNSEQHVEEAIRSVVNQTYSNLEHIIVDGCSTDRTMDIVRRYEDKIAAHISEPDRGIYDAFNKGLELATGEIIYFLNSDDCLSDQRAIEDAVKHFNNSKTKVVYGNILVRDHAAGTSYTKGKPCSLADLKRADMCPHPAFFARRSLFEQFNGFDSSYQIASDLDFIIKCFKQYGQQAVYVDRTFSIFRVGGSSTDRFRQSATNKETADIIERHFGPEAAAPIHERESLNVYYRIWIEEVMLKGRGITSSLKRSGVKKAAIFGTLDTAHMLYRDLQMEDIEIVCALDNNAHETNKKFRDVLIRQPDWLREHLDSIDAILISIESTSDILVKKQLEKIIGNHRIQIVSWKDLVRTARSA